MTIAVLVIAQPIYVYFATTKIVLEQEAVSDNLAEIAFRTTRLNVGVNRIAAESRSLQLQSDADQLLGISASLRVSIEALVKEFSKPAEGHEISTKFAKLIENLETYKSLISDETDARFLQLEAESRLTRQVINTRSISGDMLALLGSEIAAHKIELDLRIGQLESREVGANVPSARATFNNLITLNSIADAVATERFFINVVGSDLTAQIPQTRRPRLQLQMRSLATQIAKLRSGSTQISMARYAITLNDIMFGSDGVFAQIERFDMAKARVSTIVEQQQLLADQLLLSSQNLVEDAQSDVAAANDVADELIQSTRIYVLVVAALVSSLVIAAIVFVIERQFTRRIVQLTDRVISISKGEEDTGETLTGNDELSAMSDALVVFKQNATELREANDILAQRNDEIWQLSGRLETILDTTSSGIIAFNDTGQIILANLPARHFLGGISLEVPFDRPKGVTFLDREDLSPLDASADPINRVIAGQTLNNEIALMQRAGQGDGRYVRISSNRVEDAESIVCTVLVIDDVSVAEQNRQQIERSSRLDALGQLTGGIAHDFNNLLATIQYAVQLSADATDPQSRTKFTKIALDSVDRGSKLSNRLLSFAKQQPGIAKSHNVETALKEFKSLVGPTIEGFLTLEFRIDEPDMSVFCDSAQLENALLNLVLNARDAILRGNTGDKITVVVRGVAEISMDPDTSRADPDRYLTDSLQAELRNQESRNKSTAYRYVEFSVTDNGPGMTEDVKRRALDPFFSTKSTNSGTGLGLSMVYGFVQQSGGELRIYSELGRGTTMRLLLPRGSDQNEREEPYARQMPTTGDGQRILVVEDESHLLEAMEALIENLGYKVHKATSGRKALEMIKNGLEVDLLLTDIVMPGGLGGFDLAAKVRALKPELAIVYMS
ncbi:ATP-binding protein, partial [Litoreibacter sp.]|nr:ATP-binding protein [Litoreibacter sp.]